jgi:hypothetical protein
MKTITLNVYKFSELSEEAKEKAINKLYDLNIDYEWWDSVYKDAEQVNLILTEFDIASYCKGNFKYSPTDTAELIAVGHGKDCETFKTAKQFLNDLNELTGKFEDIEDCPENDIENLEDDFKQSILEDYRIMLQKEYEYRTSEAAIIESIEANDYDFYDTGELA